MSIQFYPALADGSPMLRCACDLPDEVEGVVLPGNPDSHGSAVHACARCLAQVDTHERNGRDLLAFLGLEPDQLDMGGPSAYGKILAKDLVKLCRARLNMDNAEAAIPAVDVGRVHTGGRSPTRLRDLTRELLVVATLAGSHWVAWS